MNTEQVYIGGVDHDSQRCLRCGSMHLDTGWECTDCGYDNMPHYYCPEAAAAETAARERRRKGEGR